MYYKNFTENFENLTITHSIDMIYLEFFINTDLDTFHKKIISFCNSHNFVYDTGQRDSYSKFQYYLNYIFFKGIDIKFGKYAKKDSINSEVDIIKMCLLRFNPNNLCVSSWFDEFINIFDLQYNVPRIVKLDYTVDFPLAPSDVFIPSSRKQKGLYRGTRYYGRNGRHGFIKLYDKALESALTYDLTRYEITLSKFDILPLDDVCLRVGSDYVEKLTDTDTAIIDMYSLLVSMGVEYDLKLGRKKKDKIFPFLFSGFKFYRFDSLYFNKLYDFYCKKFFVTYTDDNGFISCDFDFDDIL